MSRAGGRWPPFCAIAFDGRDAAAQSAPKSSRHRAAAERANWERSQHGYRDGDQAREEDGGTATAASRRKAEAQSQRFEADKKEELRLRISSIEGPEANRYRWC